MQSVNGISFYVQVSLSADLWKHIDGPRVQNPSFRKASSSDLPPSRCVDSNFRSAAHFYSEDGDGMFMRSDGNRRPRP